MLDLTRWRGETLLTSTFFLRVCAATSVSDFALRMDDPPAEDSDLLLLLRVRSL